MPKFRENERETVKASVTDQRTDDYIRALERIAHAAFDLWRAVPYKGEPHISERRHALYDALEVVDFMSEDISSEPPEHNWEDEAGELRAATNRYLEGE